MSKCYQGPTCSNPKLLDKHSCLGSNKTWCIPWSFPALSCLLSGCGAKQSQFASPGARADRCPGVEAGGGEIWGKNLYYHQNLVVGVTYFIRRCPKKCYPLPSLLVGWFPWEVAGGTDFVEQTLAWLKPQTVSTTLMLDLHCYNGWPALAVLQDTCFSF